jgi:hypothetical protein
MWSVKQAFEATSLCGSVGEDCQIIRSLTASVFCVDVGKMPKNEALYITKNEAQWLPSFTESPYLAKSSAEKQRWHYTNKDLNVIGAVNAVELLSEEGGRTL